MTETLTQKLALIKRDIGAVGKESRMTEGPAKYAYRGVDAILEAAHASLIRYEVSIIPADATAVYESRQSKGGNHMQWVSVNVKWEVRGAGECFPGASIGEALDSSDKATNKAHTAAHKVFLSQLFAIPYSGEDPDHSRPEAEHQAQVEVRPEAVDLQARLDALPLAARNKAILAAAKASDVDVLWVADACTNETWVEWWDALLTKAEKATAEPSESYTAEQMEPM